MAVKTYVLLENMDADALVFRQTAEGRSQIKKIPFHKPTLRQEFTDENGVGQVIRYKSSSKFIEQDKQIKEESTPANATWTNNERKDLEFRFGILTTNKEIAQRYLEAHPEFEGFKGSCDTVREPRYKLLDEKGDAKIKNEATRKRIQAAAKIYDKLDLEQAQELIIRLNGFYVKPPDDLEECQNKLIDFLDDASDVAVEAVLKEDKDLTESEKNSVLIGKLINDDVIKVDVASGMFTKNRGDGQFVDLKKVVEGTDLEDKISVFSDFLSTDDGKILKASLLKEVKGKKKKPTEDKTE